MYISITKIKYIPHGFFKKQQIQGSCKLFNIASISKELKPLHHSIIHIIVRKYNYELFTEPIVSKIRKNDLCPEQEHGIITVNGTLANKQNDKL